MRSSGLFVRSERWFSPGKGGVAKNDRQACHTPFSVECLPNIRERALLRGRTRKFGWGPWPQLGVAIKAQLSGIEPFFSSTLPFAELRLKHRTLRKRSNSQRPGVSAWKERPTKTVLQNHIVPSSLRLLMWRVPVGFWETFLGLRFIGS